jgi:hypothetical protein
MFVFAGRSAKTLRFCAAISKWPHPPHQGVESVSAEESRKSELVSSKPSSNFSDSLDGAPPYHFAGAIPFSHLDFFLRGVPLGFDFGYSMTFTLPSMSSLFLYYDSISMRNKAHVYACRVAAGSGVRH